jgi:hypothetical protein
MSLIVVARNISELAPTSDYEYRVVVGDGGPNSTVITSGTVKGHKRSDGWKKLIQQILKESE